MLCVLCHTAIDLWDLDDVGVEGMPAHKTCASAYRAEVAQALSEAEALILGEPDPRRHRRNIKPAA